MRAAMAAPTRPVMPWTMMRDALSTRIAMRPLSSARGRHGGERRRQLRMQGEAEGTQNPLRLVGVSALEANDRSTRKGCRRIGLGDAARQLVTERSLQIGVDEGELGAQRRDGAKDGSQSLRPAENDAAEIDHRSHALPLRREKVEGRH